MENSAEESLPSELEAIAKKTEEAVRVAHLLGDNAHAYAKKVYELSESCLMAHSIRSVQRYLEENGKGRHWISLTPTKSGQLLPRRAFAIIQPQQTDIIVNLTVEPEHQRRGIAHELGHLLFVKFFHQRPPSLGRIDPITESACNVFEKDLCKRHHIFYSLEANLKKLLFNSLRDHPVPA
jgi:hypothetical protein